MLELKGENQFKCRAYYAGARKIETLPTSVTELVATDQLAAQAGIGKALTEKIVELVTTGRLPYHERIKAELPEGLFDLLRIPDLGPKRVRTLYDKYDIDSLAKLEYVAKCGQLKDVPGFGAKTEQNVLQGIQMLKKMRGQYLLVDAVAVAQEIVARIQTTADPQRISIAGSVRRMKETVQNVDVVASGDTTRIMDALAQWERVEAVTARDKTQCSVVLDTGMGVELRVVPLASFAFALLYYTGSKDHNKKLQDRATSQFGYTLDASGLYAGEDEKPIECGSEEEVYRALDLDHIPPEMREDSGEIDLAAGASVPSLVSQEDIKGLIHMHTTWSDGMNSIEEMACAAEQLGYGYIVITDHTTSSHIANGLTEERLKQQWKEIDAVNEKVPGIRILKGAEVDIKPDGTLDYSDEILKKLDVVIVALHAGFKGDRETITGRVVKALSNPHVHIFAHPTGRLLLGREPYAIDMEAVIRAAGENGKVMELNANPNRLDLNWQHLKLCREYGVKVSIDPDAHRVDGFGCMPFGIGTARRGWITSSDAINTLDVDALLKTLHKK